MKKLITVYVLTALILVSVSPISANVSVEPVGDPILGNSWSSNFGVYSSAGIDLFAVKWISGQYFESPTLTDFDTSGWTLAYENPELDKTLAIATGPSSTDWIGFYTNFVGTPAEDVEFDLAVFMTGSDQLAVFNASWNPIDLNWVWGTETPSWQPTRTELNALISSSVVPAPGAILLGGIGVAFVGWLRRRRTL